jgi:hypothetical protein
MSTAVTAGQRDSPSGFSATRWWAEVRCSGPDSGSEATNGSSHTLSRLGGGGPMLRRQTATARRQAGTARGL